MNFLEYYLKEDSVLDNANFKKWFGNSKVVDKNNNPLIVYHGSNNKFNKFSYENLGIQGRSEGVGFYFTDNKQIADSYGKYLYSCYLKIEKPLRTNAKNFSRNQIQKIIKYIIDLQKTTQNISMKDGFLSNFGDIEYEGINAVLKDTVDAHIDLSSASDFQGSLIGAGVDPEIVNLAIYKVTGIDGIIAKGWGDYEDSNLIIYIPFFAKQIKSINNNGNFNSNSDNINEKVQAYEEIK